MLTNQQTSELIGLSLEDRLQLIGILRDSLDHDAVQQSPELETELDRRLGELHRSPSATVPWETVKATLLGRLA